MSEPIWVLRETVLALHEILISDFGGATGTRDWGLLDSALNRPVNRFAYNNDTDLCELAAAYVYGLIRNHPFFDGNKRIAFTVGTVFLEINEIKLVADQADAVIQTLALAASASSEPEYADWIRKNTKHL